MLRSLMSGVAGLKAYQTKMDVIGNNIANVNTVGFKSSSVNFSDVFYQTTQSASSASATNTRAGTNAKQIGYGSSVASIATTTATQGGSQTTNRALDLMINGNAFFIVQMDGQNYFTKNGSFDMDGLGNLSSESGGLVMGWGVDPETGQIVQDAVSPIRVYSPENQTAEPDATTDVYFQGNIDSKDAALEEGKVIQMDFYDNLGNQYAAKFKVISENAKDNNEYRVVLTDVIDANEQSIFVDAIVSNGATTYIPKDSVSIDFGGYTYKLGDVDKVTGEVTLISYEKDITGMEVPTEGDRTVPASIEYDPKVYGDLDDNEGCLYYLDGERFKPIPKEEIHLYAEVDNKGDLSVNNTIDQTKNCAYYYDKATKTMVPVTNGNEKISTTYKIEDFVDLFQSGAGSHPYYFDSKEQGFINMSPEKYADLVSGKKIDRAVLDTIPGGSIYYKDANGNFYKIIDDSHTKVDPNNADGSQKTNEEIAKEKAELEQKYTFWQGNYTDVAPSVGYDPDAKNTPDITDDKNTLYKLVDDKFEVIEANEISNYIKSDISGDLGIKGSITQSKDCAYYFDTTTNTMKPLLDDNNKINTIVPVSELTTKVENLKLYTYNPASNMYELENNTNAYIDTDAEGNKTLNETGALNYFYMDDKGNFLKVSENKNDEYGVNVDEMGKKGIVKGNGGAIEGIEEKTEQVEMNKGADILFNASTGKFASVSGQSTKYDENGNIITNSVNFKVYTSDSRLDTSAQNLFEEITLDFSSLTMFADGGTSTVSGVRGNLETGLGAGWATGVLTGVSVGNDGKIYGEYDNGVKQLLGQIAVTSFANPTGLEAVGNSLFKTTVNSGDFDGIGSDIYSLGLSITSGALESSNVDLSNEFTNMITTQRGFEANSKIITTSDTMLETLINLKR